MKQRENQLKHEKMVRDLVGIKSLYLLALRERWYNSFEELFYSDFEDTSHMMHIYNSVQWRHM